MAPALPAGIETLRVKGIAIGDSRLSLTLSRANGATQLQVDENPDGLADHAPPVRAGPGGCFGEVRTMQTRPTDTSA